MPFNGITYRANRFAREALANLAKAREIKARVLAGEAYDWEVPLIASYAKRAIISARMARRWRLIGRVGK